MVPYTYHHTDRALNLNSTYYYCSKPNQDEYVYGGKHGLVDGENMLSPYGLLRAAISQVQLLMQKQVGCGPTFNTIIHVQVDANMLIFF